MEALNLVILVVVAALTITSFWRILPRAGISPWFAVVSIIPLGALVLLLVLAFRPWPGDAPRA
ncbi:MAG: hypothetical protein ACFBWO_10965 [Paracoccaceae bacterium]